jgi:hypothetical protein
MTYFSRAERQRQRWMTLKEAASYIQRVDKCDEKAAEQQLRHALAEGNVEASWPLNKKALSISMRHHVVKASDRETFWYSVAISVAEGTISVADTEDDDAPQAEPFLRRREVWLWKNSIVSLWPDVEPESSIVKCASVEGSDAVFHSAPEVVGEAASQAALEAGAAGSRNEAIRPKKVNASIPAIRRELKAIYVEAKRAKTKPGNENDALRELKKRLAPMNVTRDLLRPIYHEEEFEALRWEPGQHSWKE